MPAYNNPFFNGYNNYPQYPNYTQQTQQIQNGGFTNVRSIEDVHNFPVAPGNSVTFFVESNPPVLCVKTKGFSQLDSPVIEVFDLTKREVPQPETSQKPPEYALLSDLENLKTTLRDEINAIKSQFESNMSKESGNDE